MSEASVLALILSILQSAPNLIADIENIVAAFKGGGASAANDLIAARVASDTLALEQQLKTPK